MCFSSPYQDGYVGGFLGDQMRKAVGRKSLDTGWEGVNLPTGSSYPTIPYSCCLWSGELLMKRTFDLPCGPMCFYTVFHLSEFHVAALFCRCR